MFIAALFTIKKWLNKLECVMDSYLELATFVVNSITPQIAKSA